MRTQEVQVNETAEALWRCATALAADDGDRAREQNGIGYSATDSAFGHALAKTPPEAWDAPTMRSAWLVLRKYQGQLATVGIDFSDIAEPGGADTAVRDVRSIDFEAGAFVLRFAYNPDVIAKVRTIPHRRWNGAEKRWEAPRSAAGYVAGFAKEHGFTLTAVAMAALADAPAPDAPIVKGRIDLDDVGLVITFPYDRQLVDEVRSLPVRSWDGMARVWRSPVTAIRSVLAFARANDFEVTPPVLALPDVELTIAASISVRGGQFVIVFPYDRDVIDRVRQIPGAGWSGKLGAWTAPLDAAFEVAEFAATGTMAIADSAVQALADARAALERIAASASAAAEIDIPGLGGTLRPFQAAGVLYALDAIGYTLQEDGSWAA